MMLINTNFKELESSNNENIKLKNTGMKIFKDSEYI